MSYTRGPVEPFVGDLKVHSFQLANGLVVKVIPDRQAPVVAWQTWFRVGSSDEVVGKTGLAHLFEHMMFKGTEKYTEGEFQARVDALGGSRHLNAWTWLDETVYVGAVPAAALEHYAELEASRMMGLVVDEAAFKSELEVVTNERRLVVDNDPNGILDEKLMAEAFKSHPYGWPTIGWQADLDALTSEDARRFYKRWYAPDNATVVIVGDVEPETAAQIVDRKFGALPPAKPVRARPAEEPEQTEARRVELALPLAAERLQVVFKVPGYDHEDVPALLVAAAILTSGRSARLVRALRDAGLVADVGSSVPPLRYPGAMQISLTGRPDAPIAVAERALWRELERFAEEGPSEGELALGVAQWETANWGRLMDASGKADFLGWSLVHSGNHLDGLERLRAISRVTREDVKRVAAKYLRKERSTTGVGRPEGAALAPDSPLPPLVEPASRVHVDARAAEDLADRPTDRVEEHALGTATLLSAYDPALPLVQFRLQLPVGGAADPMSKEGTAFLAGEMLLRGTAKRDRTHFEEALDQLGASLQASVGPDATTLSGAVLTRNWPALLSLAAEALAEPRFDALELARLQEEVVADLTAMLDSDEELAELALSRATWGSHHPYGRDVRGTIDSLRSVTVEDLRAFHTRAARADQALVALAGAFDKRAIDDVRGLLSRLGAGPAQRVEIPTVPQEPHVVLVDKPDRNQAQVRLAYAPINARDPSFPAFVLFNDAFGVGFGGRLMKEVRVKRGWSYFAYSHPILHPACAEFHVSLAPGNDYAVEALALVRAMIREAAEGGITAEEMEQARTTRLNGLPFEIDTAGKRLELAIRARTLGYDRLAASQAMVGLSLADVNRSFGARIRPDRLAMAVVGTASALLEKLEKEVGPVEVVPYDKWR
jgi:zinc protease